MTATEAKNTTMCSIEKMKEYIYITKRIKDRASLGYDYVKIDDELKKCLGVASIKTYLQTQGFYINGIDISWRLFKTT